MENFASPGQISLESNSQKAVIVNSRRAKEENNTFQLADGVFIFHFRVMVLHEVQRTLCESCSRLRRRDMVHNTIHSGKFDASELELGRLLGSGGFGCVYEARYRGERLAVKKLHQGTKNERAALESFEAESSILHFSHPNIVRTLAVLTIMDARCVIMEFAGERNLQSVINDQFEELGRDRRRKFSLNIATALEFAHQQGLAHLDLKPGNVLVTADDQCKLADFGCCRAVEENNKPASPTKSNLTGTYAYRAPELLKGESPTTKADIYSYGVCLWQMLTREQPYGNENQHVVIFGVVAYQLRPELNEEITGDEQYVNLIRQCWQAEAKFRPAASDIVVKLQEIASTEKGFTRDILEEKKVNDYDRVCCSQVCHENTRLH